MRRRQNGLTSVEFAIVAFVVLLTIFGVVDISRIYYTVSMLDEVTRRGARVAAVCPVNDPAIPGIAIFSPGGGTSPLVNGLDTSDIVVEYLDDTGAPVSNPATTGFTSIEFVRVRINPSFQIQTLIPLIPQIIIPTPPMTTTMPRESLGIPRDGVAAQPC